MASDALAQRRAGIQYLCPLYGWAKDRRRAVFRRVVLTRPFVEPMDVGQIDRSRAACAAWLILQHNLHLKIRLPLFRQQRVVVEDRTVLEIVFQPFIDGQVRRDNDKMLG